MADPRDQDSEVELLKRQNRRPKVLLSVVTTLLLIAMGLDGIGALRARAAEAQARAELERARVAEERALQMAEDGREQSEGQTDIKP